MFPLVKCTLVFNSKHICRWTIIAKGYHRTPVLHNVSAVKTNQEKSPYQPVADFYTGKSVFLTGGTGFLGKVFIERLLSNCSNIDKIYVLIRGKKGSPAEQRLQHILQTPLFTKLKNTNPEQLDKVVAIAGDVTEPNLGLKPKDEETLLDKVSVVFHSAATVRFIDTFKEIIDVNVEGTRKVMDLSKRMKNMEMFVHISTAFSNSDKYVTEEIVYPCSKTLEDVQQFLKHNSNDEEAIEKYIKGHANTYTFSKQLTESLVFENHGNMPTIIVRPSIVSPVLEEPMPGWIDSWVASTALFSNIARGYTRIARGGNNVIIDMIPVDYVCNLCIVAAAKSPKTKQVAVYNSCTSSTNHTTWKEGADLFRKNSRSFGYKELPLPKAFFLETSIALSALSFIIETIPAFTADVWLRLTGRKPKHIKEQMRANLLRDLIVGFTSNSFIIKSNRALELISSLDEEDRRRFSCDPRTINWEEYMPVFCFGVKQYLLSNGKSK